MIASIAAVIDMDPPGDTSVASRDHISIPRPIATCVRLNRDVRPPDRDVRPLDRDVIAA
jgi:hypothetical protein